MKFFLLRVLFVLLFFDKLLGLLLSKSSVQICENRGLHGQGDPQDLVNGKTCEKKLVVVMTVKNEQNGTEKLLAQVSRVRDDTSSEYARLYNPFLITLAKSPVMINYPYFFTGYTVNNKPVEEIRKSKGNWWAVDSSKQCYDQWQETEKEELKPTCGYDYKSIRKKQADGSYKEEKQRIWDSQGFCCHCTLAEKDAYTAEEAQNFKRSGLTCKFATKSSQASAHCMRMDKLWYTVHSFTESYRDFTIHVRAFDQIEKVINNKKVVESVNGGEIILSPSVKSGVGKYKRIIAHYVGDFAPVKSYPVLSERYFLIPKKSAEIDARTHPQVRDGIAKYLILPMSYVDLQSGACDKVGVSYSSFRNQATSGEGFGCRQKAGYCLANQPWHYFQNDEERIGQGKTPLYFPARFGKLVGSRKPLKKDDEANTVLSFVSEEDHVSLVTLQISADDVILIYNRAVGDIVRAAIKDFEAQSLDGKLHVEVLNKGFVTADFYVAVPTCSGGIEKVEEKGASINPQMTKSFVFSLKTSNMEGATYTCIVQLFDAKREKLGQRNVSFSTSTPCICEEVACRCECTQDGGVKCEKNEGEHFVNPKLFEVKKAGGLFSNIANFFTDVLSFPTNLFGGLSGLFSGLFGSAWQWIRYIFMVGALVLALWLFNCLGGRMILSSILGKFSFYNKTKEKVSRTKQKLKKNAGELKRKTKKIAEKAAEKTPAKLKEKCKELNTKVAEKKNEFKENIKNKVSEKKHQVKESIKNKVSEKKNDFRLKKNELKENIKNKVSEKKNEVKESIKNKVAEKKNDFKEKKKELKENIKNKVSEKKEEFKENIKSKGKEIKHSTKSLLKRKADQMEKDFDDDMEMKRPPSSRSSRDPSKKVTTNSSESLLEPQSKSRSKSKSRSTSATPSSNKHKESTMKRRTKSESPSQNKSRLSSSSGKSSSRSRSRNR